MSEAGTNTWFGLKVRAVHCVGVAGMGLGPLALYLTMRGCRVSGEDDALLPAMEKHLLAGGVKLGASGALPEGVDLLVISSAVKANHPTVIAAKERGVPVRRRGEMLAEATRDQRLIGVCGSHGKTTTTAMIISAFKQAGVPLGYVSGGLFGDEALSPGVFGKNGWVVAELDESDGTISGFSPEITVLVNLDWDHPDHYRTQEDLENTFAQLLQRTRSTVLYSSRCTLSGKVVDRSGVKDKAKSFGVDGQFQLLTTTPTATGQHLALAGDFGSLTVDVRAVGEFNAWNATAALAAVASQGTLLTASLLNSFSGVRRRQSFLPAVPGYTVIEDYAHHPSEIEALLTSLRSPLGKERRLVVVFQPHRYSRTKQFLSAFARSLSQANRLYLIDVYGAGEAPMDGGTTADLYAEVRQAFPSLPVCYSGSHVDSLLVSLAREVRPGDVIAFVGAGDIDQRAREWLVRLESKEADESRWDSAAATIMADLSTEARIRREEPLAERTTMRVGGAARILVEPAKESDLAAVLRVASEKHLPLHILGRGSNLVVPDVGVDGIVVSFTHAFWQSFEKLPNGRVRVGAGLRLKNLCGLATKAGLAGFEFLEGIPGNVGGALRMNAGAMGGWTFDVVEEVRMMGRDGKVVTKRKEEMHVDYRHCAELQESIALSAILRPASQSEAAAIASQIDGYREKRQKTQPREPSAGCIFKNPTNDAAGRLIDQSGLKTLRVGDAMVSPVHANFIVNTGNATSADVVELVRRVRARVKQAKGVELEPEVILYGREWRDVL